MEETRCFLVEGVTVQRQPDGVVRLQAEIGRKGLLPGKSLPIPSPERVFVGLEVEKRKPVNIIAQKGSQKSLSLSNSTHYHSQLLLKELKGNRKNAN